MLNIEEIKAREQAATPGPWNRVEHKRGRFYVGTDKKPIADICNLYHTESEANLAFISHARTDISELIAEVERLTKENKALAKNGGKYIEISQKRYEMFEKASKRAENAEIERDTLKKALMQAIREGHTDLSPASHKKLFDHYIQQAQEKEGKK